MENLFCTEDVGKLVEGPNGKQFLQITDRKKELLKTSGGKYVAPTPIESKFQESFLVEQMMVVGEQRKIRGRPDCTRSCPQGIGAKENQVAWTTFAEMIHHPEGDRRVSIHWRRDQSKLQSH